MARREYFKPSAIRLAETARNVGPTASFYTISMGSGAIGYAISTVDTLPDAIRAQDLPEPLREKTEAALPEPA